MTLLMCDTLYIDSKNVHLYFPQWINYKDEIVCYRIDIQDTQKKIYSLGFLTVSEFGEFEKMVKEDFIIPFFYFYSLDRAVMNNFHKRDIDTTEKLNAYGNPQSHSFSQELRDNKKKKWNEEFKEMQESDQFWPYNQGRYTYNLGVTK